MKKTAMLLALLLVTGCAATPDEVRQHCLAHDVPHSMSAGQVAGTVAGAVLTLGFSLPIQKGVNEGRSMADCSEILGDETLKESCPAYVAYCEQCFAERRNAAGASKVIINNESPPPRATFTNCTDTGVGVNCVSH